MTMSNLNTIHKSNLTEGTRKEKTELKEVSYMNDNTGNR